jgi:hypothetical protein
MNRADLLKDMKNMVGTRDPIEFFDKMVEMFGLLFDRIDQLQDDLHQVKVQSALAIKWEPRVASDMLAKQIEILRQDKETYFNELSSLKKAFVENVVTQNYDAFCNFWVEVLGWHPFLEYK